MKNLCCVALALGLFASLSPAMAQATDEFTIELSPLKAQIYNIKRIRMTGNARQEAIKLAMYTRIGDQVTQADLDKDKQRIHELGYFSFVSMELRKLIDGYELIINAQEYPPLKEIHVLNDTQLKTHTDIQKYFASQMGKTLNITDIQKSFSTILESYHSQGYALAHIEIPDQNAAYQEGVLKFKVHEGLLTAVRFKGNELTKNHVLERELALVAGTHFNTFRLAEDTQRLHRLQFFESVEPAPVPNPDQHTYTLVYTLKEAKSKDAGFNFTLGNRNGLVGGVYYKDTNFLGEGRQLNVDLKTSLNFLNPLSQENLQSPRTLFGRLDFFDPWLLPGHVSFGSSLFSERNPITFFADAEPVLQTRTGVNLRMGRPLFGDIQSPWRGSLSFTAEQIGLQGLDLQPRPDLTLSQRLSGSDHQFSLGGTLSLDTRNFIPNPTQGVFGSISAQPFWGDGSYLRLTGNMSTYLPLIDWLTLALNIQGGSLLGPNPPYEQFFATGFSAIRGWQENGQIFGKHYLLGSMEARFPIFNPVSGVLFADVGEFFSSATFNPLNPPFKYGVGAGVRVNTPLGLLRLDYGVRDFGGLQLNTLLEAGQIHFSMGHKF